MGVGPSQAKKWAEAEQPKLDFFREKTSQMRMVGVRLPATTLKKLQHIRKDTTITKLFTRLINDEFAKRLAVSRRRNPTTSTDDPSQAGGLEQAER